MKTTYGLAMLVAAAALTLSACGGGGGAGGGGGGNAAKGKDLFTSKQCITCHTLAAVPGAVGIIGPNLNKIGTDAATRKPGVTAEAYIRESIKDPNAFIAPGFTAPSLMIPPVPVSDPEITDLVAFLITQK